MTPDNFAVRVQGDGVSLEAVTKVLEELRTEAFWVSAATREARLAKVPEYRLSKFQRVLPERWQVEMVGGVFAGLRWVREVVGGGVWVSLIGGVSSFTSASRFRTADSGSV